MRSSFEQACDRLSNTVDGIQFERLRWGRTEGPMLARLVALAQEAVDAREDFDLSEEGSVVATKRFVIKVHGNRIAALSIGLVETEVSVWVDAIGRSPYRVAAGDAVSADYAVIDFAWMAAALAEVFGRIEG